MRSILNTTVAFGMVRVPVKVYTATSSHDLGLHQYHRTDAGRIRYEKVCEYEDEPGPSDAIVKGFEDDDGEVVVLDEEDLADLPASSKTIEVQAFVPAGQIDPVYYEKSYYLGPGPAGTDPYLVLRDALRAKDRVALVTFTMRQRESLAAIRPHDDVLVLDTVLWADEVRIPQLGDALGETAPADRAELEMAGILIDAKSGDWNPEPYTDEYQQALIELIDAKRHGREAPKARRERRPKVVSLMDALEKSVASVDPDRLPTAKKTARKSAKKAAKRSGRKTAEKSTARKRSRG